MPLKSKAKREAPHVLSPCFEPCQEENTCGRCTRPGTTAMLKKCTISRGIVPAAQVTLFCDPQQDPSLGYRGIYAHAALHETSSAALPARMS